MTVENQNYIDINNLEIREKLLKHCRLKLGDIWTDKSNRHVIACGDATDLNFLKKIFENKEPAALAIHDPPYNLVMFKTREVSEFIKFCKKWIDNSNEFLSENSSLYIWLGADQRNHFKPLPEFMAMMSETEFMSRSFITMRNQRGYGTQKNWMAVRQELLYYTKGTPKFKVQYTDIPKILRGYYKEVAGVTTENMERSKSENIRSSNVWVDIQQVFYRMKENVNGCPAQKPLKAIERIILASSSEDETVLDFFGHSGTTIIAAEKNKRKSISVEIDPLYCEISIRRLEHFQKTGQAGWQNNNPFEKELKEIIGTEFVAA